MYMKSTDVKFFFEKYIVLVQCASLFADAVKRT